MQIFCKAQAESPPFSLVLRKAPIYTSFIVIKGRQYQIKVDFCCVFLLPPGTYLGGFESKMID